MVSPDAIRTVALSLPRTEEALVRRYNWVRVRLDAIDHTEMRELVVDAWRMVVPKRVAVEHLGS